MRILYAASEAAGFAKTGGLADVVSSLPRAMAQRGHECAIILPLYRGIRTGSNSLTSTGLTFKLPLGSKELQGALWRSTLPDAPVPVYLIEHEYFFERDNPDVGWGIYQLTLPGNGKRDYADNAARFSFFCRAVLEVVRLLEQPPDVLHLNDWQTGLIPVYLRESYARQTDTFSQARYRSLRTLLTLHNVAYQGSFPKQDLAATGLPERLFNPEQLEIYGRLNFLKAGIVYADLLNTVSPTYAREMQTRYFGSGLQNVVAARAEHLCGIVNGADYHVWNPLTDPHIAQRYGPDEVTVGKSACKAALQKRVGLPLETRTPLVGMVSRLAEQKGFDLIGRVADRMMSLGIQLVVLGQGEAEYQQMLTALSGRYPTQVRVQFTLDEMLAHQIEAGADLFLMPSEYEPCGLSQLYSLKYGTMPLVRATGGLADTVVDATPAALEDGTATGFSFVPYTPAALLSALGRALDLYRGDSAIWKRLQQTGMRQDWSWGQSAAQYEKLYEQLIGASGAASARV